MVYSIDSIHLNYDHMYPMQLMQIFSSTSSVPQHITPEQLNQINIVAHRWKQEILSFPIIFHSSKSVTNFKGRNMIVA